MVRTLLATILKGTEGASFSDKLPHLRQNQQVVNDRAGSLQTPSIEGSRCLTGGT